MVEGHPESGNGVPEHREYKDRETAESVGEGPQHSAADKETREGCRRKAGLVRKSEEPTRAFMEDPAANQSRAESGGKGQVVDLEASTQGEQCNKLPGVRSGRSRRSEPRGADCTGTSLSS